MVGRSGTWVNGLAARTRSRATCRFGSSSNPLQKNDLGALWQLHRPTEGQIREPEARVGEVVSRRTRGSPSEVVECGVSPLSAPKRGGLPRRYWNLFCWWPNLYRAGFAPAGFHLKGFRIVSYCLHRFPLSQAWPGAQTLAPVLLAPVLDHDLRSILEDAQPSLVIGDVEREWRLGSSISHSRVAKRYCASPAGARSELKQQNANLARENRRESAI